MGFEPTTLALYEGSSLSLSQRAAAMETKRTIQIPPAPSFLCKSSNIEHQARFEKANQGSKTREA